MLKIYLIHTAGALIALEALRRSGAHPASLFLAFQINYFYRLLTLKAALKASSDGSAPGWARYITRPPSTVDKNEPIRQGDVSGPPAPIYAYFLTILVTTYFGVILAHSTNSSNFDITWGKFFLEFLAASGLALIWWGQDIANRALVADLKKGLVYNLGFNSHEASISTLTVLAGAAVLVAGEAMGFPRNPWMLIAPLLFFKWLWGVWLDKRYMASQAEAGDK